MERDAAFFGAFAYEYRMQIRRKAVWVSVIVVMCLSLAISLTSNLQDFRRPADGPLQITTIAVGQMSGLLAVLFAILLSDRVPRERKLRTDELLRSVPIGSGTTLWAKYLGAVAATCIPILLAYIVLIVPLALRLHNAALLPPLVPVALSIVLPGLLFVGAFSIACTEILPIPLYAILFIGYWFWGNYYAPGMAIPSLACTPLTPIGRYAAIGFFHQDPDLAATCGLTSQSVSVLAGIGSIALLLVTAALAIVALRTYKDWRAAGA